ncbi:kinase-like domain-containing protein [Chlamydoabsidia padenii]|nr:kinase-like domain-containing protein [Chlamydoabsidia padenii]
MGFFQSIFHKDVHRSTMDKSTNKRQNPTLNNANTLPGAIPLPQQDQLSNHQTPPSSPATTKSHPLPVATTTTTTAAVSHGRFHVNEDSSHTHHLTMPAPSRFTGLVDGLIQLDKSIRRGWGGDKKQPAHTSPDGQSSLAPDLVEERAAIDATLQRKPSTSSFAQKWGDCQEVIGRGAFGVVRVAHKKDTPDSKEQLYAVKEFRKRSSESTKSYVKRLTSEFCIASTLHHINVIDTLDLLPLNDTSSMYCQVMGYCDGGDLFNVIYECSYGGLQIAEANCFFKQLICGVDYIHSMGIAHRDLKPENLLLTSTGCLKISDFGSAECFRVAWEGPDAQGQPIIHKSKGLVGSEPYIAPEEFIQDEYDARKVDIWSCGIIYLAMRTGTHIWNIAKQGEDEAYDRYLKFRRLVDEERENAKRERSLRRQQLQLQQQQQQESAIAPDGSTMVDGLSSDLSVLQLEREISVLKAKETIKKKAKEGGYDVLEDLDFASKKLIYRLLDPSGDKRIHTSEIFKNEWFSKIKSCQTE